MTTKTSALAAVGMAWLAGDVGAQAQLPGYGHAASGMAGASIAFPYDSIATANNPAGMAFVGSRVDVLLTPIFTEAATTLGPFDYNASDVGFGPSAGFNRDLQNGWTLGMSIFGFGSSFDYGKPFPGSTTNTVSSVTQVVVAPTTTFRVAPDHAVGLALLLAGQKIEISGLQGFGFADAGSDTSSGVGASIGYLGRLAPGIMVGLTYSSKVDMGRLDKYRDLLADGGNLDIPQQAGIGLSWQVTPELAVAFDYLWINWSSSKPLGNPYPGSGPPGSVDGPGFGWQNQNVYRLGTAWDASDQWTLRAGAAYKSKLIVPESVTLSTLGPITPQVTLTLGATYRLNERQIVTGAFASNLERSVTGTRASEGVAITASANFFTLGWGYRY